MYTILNKKGEPVVFQKFNFHGLVYLSNTTKMNMIVYKNNMIFLSGIYIPKKDYTCKFIDINKFINYNEVSSIVDCTDFMVENKYQSIIKIDNYKNKKFYLNSKINGETFEVNYYYLVLMMYSYYLMYQVDKKDRFKKLYEKIDKFLTENYWEREE